MNLEKFNLIIKKNHSSDEISPCRSDKPGLNLDQSLATTFEISETDEDRFALHDDLLCPFDSLSQYDIIDNVNSKTIERPGTPQPWSKKDQSRSSLEPPVRLNPVQECNPGVSKKSEKAVKRSRGCSPDKLSPGNDKMALWSKFGSKTFYNFELNLLFCQS